MDVNVCGMRYGHAVPPPPKGKTTAKKDATRPLACTHLKSSHTLSPMYIHTSCTYALFDRIMVPKVHNIVNRQLLCTSAVYKCGAVCVWAPFRCAWENGHVSCRTTFPVLRADRPPKYATSFVLLYYTRAIYLGLHTRVPHVSGQHTGANEYT